MCARSVAQDLRELFKDCGQPIHIKYVGRKPRDAGPEGGTAGVQGKVILYFETRSGARNAHEINGSLYQDSPVRSCMLPPVPRESIRIEAVGAGPRWSSGSVPDGDGTPAKRVEGREAAKMEFPVVINQVTSKP